MTDYIANISLDKVENRFLFVIVAAKRALQLQKGAKPRVELPTRKPTVTAMMEELENKIQYTPSATMTLKKSKRG